MIFPFVITWMLFHGHFLQCCKQYWSSYWRFSRSIFHIIPAAHWHIIDVKGRKKWDRFLKLDLSRNSPLFTRLFREWRRISELKYFYFLDWIPRKSPLTHESHHHFGLFTLVMAHCGTDTRKKNTMLTCWSPRPWRRLPCFHWTRCRPHCITLAFSHLVTRIKAMIWQNLEVRSLEYGRMTQDNIYIMVD